MAVKYLRLFDPTQQFQLKGGQLNVAGRLYVRLEATDDLAPLFDEYSTQLTQPVILDNNGRAPGLFVDSAKTYWLDVQDQYGESVFTVRRMTPCGGGGGSNLGNTYDIVSTDGSISIDKFNDGGTTTYDLGIAPGNSDEFLEWIKCSEEDCGSTWIPVYQEGTMETTVEGIHVHKGQLYHFTSTFYVDPDGTGINYDTFKASMYCNDKIVDVRDFDIDSSLNDSVMCEFSTDLIPEEDGYVYYKLTIPSTCEVTAEVQCHRIYSGINAVPDTCATKQWVQETFDYNLSGKVDYSAIEYNPYNEITGISGSAIAAGSIDSAFVSSVASSYAESAVSSISSWSGYFSSISSKVDQSAFDDCCSAVHSSLDEKLDKSASGLFQPSGSYVSSTDMSAYVPFSGLEGEGGKVTGISGSAFKGHEYTGINPVNVDNTADTISVYHKTLCVDNTMTAYDSGSSAVIGVNVAGLNLSSKMDASASSLFYSTSNPSGFITGVDLSPYQLTADMSGYQVTGDYAYNSSLSSKLDASASSEFYSTSNPSGFLTAHQSLAGYATEAYVDSSVSSKLDTTAFSTVSGDFLTSHQSLAGYATESYVDSAVSGKLDVTASSLFLTSLPDDLAYTSDVASAVSGKLDASASSDFYPMTGNPSGFLTAHQSLVGYATEQYVDSSVSGKLDATAYDSAEFYTTANPSGFITGVDLTPYQLTANMSAYQLSGDYYSASNPSGFITGVDLSDYATTAYVDSSVSGKQDASAMTAYQPVGDYQPSGDYIYVSALGWAEV